MALALMDKPWLMEHAPSLIFPAVNLAMRQQGNQMQVWDAFRKKWILLGPEEWVRQHLAHFVCSTLGYPSVRLLLEHQLHHGKHSRRYDLVLLSRDLRPLMLVECKSPSEQLNEDVWWQVHCYNQELTAIFLVITNGLEMKIRMRTGHGWQSVENLPSRAEWEKNPG
jgi:hypothetical protein